MFRFEKKGEPRCGVPWLVETTPDDPFYYCCVMHDEAYETIGHGSTKEIDGAFLDCCLHEAGEDKPLQVRAKLYYRLARTYGILRRGVFVVVDNFKKIGVHKCQH